MGTEPSVVITGASTGIGEACALRLDKMGFRVFAGVRKEADGNSLKQQSSDRLTPVMIDVTDAALIDSAVATVSAAVGDAGLAGLVNNAGVGIGGPLEFLPIAQIRKVLEVNVIGQIAVTQAFLPLLRKRRGRIVNMGSITGRSSSPIIGPYSASKFAMEAITDALRVELRPWGISVSIIEPGDVATPIWDKSLAATDEVLRNLPQRAQDLYGPALTTMREVAVNAPKIGISPDIVARAVAHALTAKKPKTRYLVGRDAKFRVLLEFLPDRVRDWLIARYIWRSAIPED